MIAASGNANDSRLPQNSREENQSYSVLIVHIGRCRTLAERKRPVRPINLMPF